ncbi:MAG: T9SS type A sorting domain-containing protein, partial [Bacteroidales bacterium]|nr:T9SS type A sorting domain-containing protein [Bacteroidales bacterium]
APGAISGTTVAGGNGYGSNANQLAYPYDVFVDGSGNIFIADRNNHRIQKWAPGATSGATVAGGNGSGSAANQLAYPIGVFVDGAGTIFIADQSNHRIQKWAPGATSGATVAGGNGYGSNANQLYSPFGVHVDGSGNIFIADYSNHRIQKWGGTFITSYTPVVGGTYIAVVTTASGCTVVTNEIVITEFCCTNPTNGGEIAESQTICYGTLTVPFTGASVPTGYVGDLEYQWQISTASPTFADIPGVFSETYTHVGTVTQTTWFRRLAKVTCETDWVESNVVEITVDPLSEGGTVTNAQTICSDETPADLELTGHVGNVLRWQRSANAAFTSPVNISVTSTTLSGSTIGAVTQDTWFRAEVQSGVCDPAYSDAVKITIDTNPPYATPINNTVALNPSGTYTLAVNDLLSVYGDNENSVASITMTPSTFNCTKLGQTITVEVKVVDECNNETIVYSNITVQEGTGLPAPWLNANTHASANGTAIYSPCDDEGTFMLTATGKSTTTKDVHHFVHQQLCGNGTVIARLDEVQNGGWAGVMMRESNAHASKAILFKTRLYNPNVIIGYRTSTGSAMRNLSQVAQLIRWMKIQRSGSNFKVFTSYNGTTWQQRYSGTISMNSCIQAGIFTESVLASRTSVAWFDNVEVVPFLKAGDDFAGVDVIEMDKEQVQIDLYPNPADDQVTIFIAGNESEVSYQISDMEGRLIGQSTFTGSEFLLDVSNYKPGLYVIRFEIDGEIFTKRLVVM